MLRGTESLPLPRWEGAHIPHGGQCRAHAAVVPRYHDAPTSDREVLRDGEARSTPQQPLHPAIREWRISLYTSPRHRHFPTRRRTALRGLSMRHVRSARRSVLQRRLCHEQLCHHAQLRPRSSPGNGALQGGWQLCRQPLRKPRGTRLGICRRILSRPRREEVHRRVRSMQLLRHQERHLHHAHVHVYPPLHHQRFPADNRQGHRHEG